MNFRAYLAILKDSLREALASYVLWILLGLITVVLLLLAPVGLQPHLTIKFAPTDIADARQLIGVLQAAGDAAEPSPAKRVWSFMDEGERAALIRFLLTGKRNGRGYFEAAEKLTQQLNQVLERDDLYDVEIWPESSLPGEARTLLAKPRKELSQAEKGRLNRLLVESAVKKQVRGQTGMSANLTYLWFAPTDPWPMSPQQIRDFLEKFVVTNIMSWLVGVIAVFVAILVTSPLVPWMLEPGSIHLLLSKPISRSLLFLTKFAGGCAFILVSVAYLLTGLWLILGMRLGIWNHRLLWCIPVFLFLFAIYYSVASLAGLIWKNAIVSVVVTIAFFLVCFGLGALKLWVAEPYFGDQRITRLVNAADDLLAVTEDHALLQWSAERREWQRIREPDRNEGLPRLVGPFWHAPTQQLVLASGSQGLFGLGGSSLRLNLAKGEDGWRMQNGPDLPAGSATLVWEPDGKLLVVGTEGVYRLAGELARAQEPVKLFGFTLPLGSRDAFTLISSPAETSDWRSPLAATFAGDDLLVVSGSTIHRLQRDPDGKYRVAASATLEGDERDGAVVAAGGGIALVAREDGKITLLEVESLKQIRDERPEPFSEPRFASQSPDGKWIALLYQNRRLWLLDTASRVLAPARLRGQADVSAAAFDDKNQLLVADRITRVTTYAPDSLRPQTSVAPPLPLAAKLDYYLLTGLYNFFPKPGELDYTVQYVLTGKSTVEWDFLRGNIDLPRKQRNPWRPVTSGLAFMGIMLLIACVYLERSEF